ncbi:MAG: TMEM14 family protein [Planctomycetota bacterium]
MNIKDVTILLLIYAVMLMLGGLMGFIKAKSKPSLIAGSLSGLMILVSIYLMNQTGSIAQTGCLLATFTSLSLALFFGKRFAKSRKLMPGGVMAVFSVAIFILLVLAGPRF